LDALQGVPANGFGKGTRLKVSAKRPGDPSIATSASQPVRHNQRSSLS